jgi:hypothetical protein
MGGSFWFGRVGEDALHLSVSSLKVVFKKQLVTRSVGFKTLVLLFTGGLWDLPQIVPKGSACVVSDGGVLSEGRVWLGDGL